MMKADASAPKLDRHHTVAVTQVAIKSVVSTQTEYACCCADMW
jgi:hypothetical protein